MTAVDPFFTPTPDGFLPTAVARDPGQPDRQAGAALAGLLARSLQAAPAAATMNIARLTIDLLHPAPFAPTQVLWRVLREGRRTTVLEASLTAGGLEAARASALFVRRAEEGAPATVFAPPFPAVEDAPQTPIEPGPAGFETRLVTGGLEGGVERPRAWIQPTTEVVAGEGRDPLAAAMMAASFTLRLGEMGAASGAQPLDIAVHFVRPPRETWILVDADTLAPGGAALAHSQLSDRSGLFAHAQQTLATSRFTRADAA